MRDIAVVDLKRGSRKASSVHRKTMRTKDGRNVRVLSLDANSKTFVDDLTKVFKINVRKARQENKKLFGSADGLLPKQKTKK